MQRSWRQLVRGGDFPYWEALEHNYRLLHDAQPEVERLGTLLPNKEAHRNMALYDYWKMVLCMREPSAFAYTQSLEARVRLFAGMCWASSVGVACSLLWTISLFWGQGAWWPAILMLFLASIVIFLAFRLRLRFVRAEEANQVFLAYMAHLTSSSAGPNRSCPPATPGLPSAQGSQPSDQGSSSGPQGTGPASGSPPSRPGRPQHSAGGSRKK